jgi:hypothetical protein
MQRLAWQCTRGVLIADGATFHLVAGEKVIASYWPSDCSEWDERTTSSYAVEDGTLRETRVHAVYGEPPDTKVIVHLEGLVPTDGAAAEAVLARRRSKHEAEIVKRREAGWARVKQILRGRTPPGREVLIARLESEPDDPYAIALLEALAEAPSRALVNATREAMFARVDEQPPPAPPPTGRLAQLHADLLQRADWWDESDSNHSAAAYRRAAAWVAVAAVTDRPPSE